MKKPLRPLKLIVAILILGFGVGVTVVWMQRHRAANQAIVPESREIQKPVDSPASRSEETAKTVETSTTPPSPIRGVRQFESFRLRPFAAVKSSGAHEWTAEDARSPEAIRNLAHNELEVQRLLEENARIERRQLVYRKVTVPSLLERSLGSGQRLQSFTLPGLDGQEIEVEVTETNVGSSLESGSVTGRVKGRYNSTVTVGFSNGRESFNVLSPEDGLFLTADAREPGEVLVKQIIPDKYAPQRGGEPIINNEPIPSFLPPRR